MAASKIQIPLKVFIHKQEGRVLYAEADSDFVDILFSFLTMPMGTIIRLLSEPATNSSKQNVIGSLNNIYKSIANLEAEHFATGACKDILLNTRNSAETECRKLKINVDDISPIKYYTCEDMSCTENGYTAFFSMYLGVKCKNCSKVLSRWAPIDHLFIDKGQKGVFVKQNESFLITNDLHVFPNVPSSTLAILENLGSSEFELLEEKTFQIGCTEILDLLKYSMLSTTPLTSMFLSKNNIVVDKSVKTMDIRICIGEIISFKKMEVNVLVQRSSNKIILAHSSQDFIELLFTLLTVPLGRVISLVSKGYAPAFCVENIHKSVLDLSVDKYFTSKQTKDVLLFPKSSMIYQCSNQLFPVEEDRIPRSCRRPRIPFDLGHFNLSFGSGHIGREVKLASVMDGGFLKGSTTKFMVTDDLVVTPFTSMSCMKYIRSCNLGPSDIEEQVIDIGTKEALNLLAASLASTSVLTNGLKDLLRCRPQTERLVKKAKVEK